jgi:hypothetical protein
MRNSLKILVLAVVGYATYELVTGYFRHRETVGGPAGRGEIPVKAAPAKIDFDSPGGTRMTGGGKGRSVQYDAGDATVPDDSAGTSTRVGRGVI